MRLGLFGGTFDPIHMGHLILAETIRSDFPLDRIFFIPAAVPPHKQRRRISSSEARVEMLTLALEDHPYFDISMAELEIGGVCYTIDTVRHFLDQYNRDTLYLIIGGDSLGDLLTWKKPYELLDLIQVLVVHRPGYPLDDIEQDIRKRISFISMPLIDISSTTLRERIKSDQSIRYRVPEKVEAYIREKGLYQ